MSNQAYTSNIFPRRVSSGYWPEGHVQGIAIDEAGGYIYFSFTTILLKTDLTGNPVGSVCNIVGHLGCITFDPDRRRVYGSLELKHDAIGRGIVSRTGRELAEEDAFYLVSFDCDAITSMDMDWRRYRARDNLRSRRDPVRARGRSWRGSASNGRRSARSCRRFPRRYG